MSATLNSALVADLAREVSGSVLGPQDAGYEAARAVHNGMVDRRPALIVRCRTACDVAAALALARRAGLEVSIRGGGHNVAGRIERVAAHGLVVNIATQRDDEIVTFRAARFDRAKGARIYTLNLFDELACHASGAGDLARLCTLMAEGRLDGQIELDASWRDPSRDSTPSSSAASAARPCSTSTEFATPIAHNVVARDHRMLVLVVAPRTSSRTGDRGR